MTSEYFAHPRALVEMGARIGAQTRIWAFAHVMAKAQIGANCNIGNYVFVENGVVLGNGITVKNGVQLWEGVHAEDNVFIGPGCVFTNHLTPRAFHKTPKQRWLGRTTLQRGCTVGASATILPGTTIGRYAFVGAGAVVVDDVPAFALVMGHPARFYEWRCLCARTLYFQKGRARCASCASVFVMTKDKKGVRLIKRAKVFAHA